jgi:FixJ family two-component response regulator
MDKNKLVIIVDGHPSLRTAICRLLGSAGYAVKVFPSGEDLLRHGVSGAGCLVVDIALPGMSGLELHECLRMASGACPPVVFYTGGDDPEGRLRALAVKAGALALLQKPFEGEELLEVLTKAWTLPSARRDQG